MPTFSSELNNLFTSTLYQYSQKKSVDQIYLGSVLLQKLKSKGAVKPADGGVHIREPLRTGQSPVYSIDYRESVQLLPKEILTAALYDWRIIVTPLLLYEWELDLNSGTNKVLNLMQERMDEVETAMRENINQQLFADGTGNSGKDIIGLSTIVHPTGALGGISITDVPTWKSYQVDHASNIVNFDIISTAISEISYETEPDLIICPVDIWTKLHNTLPADARYIDQTVANWGFSNFTIRGKMPMVADRHCPANTIFVLTTDHLKLRYHPKRNFTPRGFVDVPNMLATANLFTFAGNMTCNSRRTQGKLINVSAT